MSAGASYGQSKAETAKQVPVESARRWVMAVSYGSTSQSKQYCLNRFSNSSLYSPTAADTHKQSVCNISVSQATQRTYNTISFEIHP